MFMLLAVLGLRDELIPPTSNLPPPRIAGGLLPPLFRARDKSRQQALQIGPAALRTLRRVGRPHQRLELVPARAAMKIVQRHTCQLSADYAATPSTTR